MKKEIKILIGLIILSIVGSVGLGIATSSSRITYVAPEAEVPLVTHAQETWIRALEWCESRGNVNAVNPKDKDSTPSYYSWQFKPGTFRSYGEKYGVIEKDLTDEEIMIEIKDWNHQEKIMEYMVNDKGIKWEHEFPDCVKRKVGRPPVN